MVREGCRGLRSDRIRCQGPPTVHRPPEGSVLVDLCIRLANVVYLLSFLVRDMLHLRVLTCVGLMLGIVFFTCQPMPLYGPSIWHVVFLVINAVQIRRLVLER